MFPFFLQLWRRTDTLTALSTALSVHRRAVSSVASAATLKIVKCKKKGVKWRALRQNRDQLPLTSFSACTNTQKWSKVALWLIPALESFLTVLFCPAIRKCLEAGRANDLRLLLLLTLQVLFEWRTAHHAVPLTSLPFLEAGGPGTGQRRYLLPNYRVP